MAVRITELKAESLGPLPRFAMNLGALNLIYGRNECGKTFLVEFIICSLFKNTTAWNLRDVSGARGHVQVSGLSDKPVSFSPAGKKRKLEDYLRDSCPGLPVSLPRLLVAKGADLKIVQGGDSLGINRTTLRDYLSGAETLDSIDKNIKTQVRKATIENGTINGTQTGVIKDRKQALDRKETVDGLLARIDRDFSGGRAGILNAQLQSVQAQLAIQERAKRQRAYALRQEIVQLQAQRDAMPKEDLESLASSVRDFERNMTTLT